ncbi:unnamed protein product, partial [Owenia fusiformis]
ARDCTVDGEKVAPGKTWKSDDGCLSCKCKRGKCKIRTSKKKCQTTTTTTTKEVVFENIFPKHNEADETETSDIAPKPPTGRGGIIFKPSLAVCSEHSGYEVTTLTSNDRYSNTNDEFKIRIYAGGEWTDYEILNNPGYDRRRKQWDRYGPLMSLNDDPVDYVQVEHVSGTDGWKIFTIFVRHLCTNKIFEFNCGGCWIDRPQIPFLYIKRTN